MLTGLVGLLHKAKFLANENSTTILTGMGVVGTVSTAYLTGRATFKAAEIIRQEEQAILEQGSDDSTELVVVSIKLTTMAKVKAVWRHYIPAFSVCSVTIACIIAANRIASKKIAALAIASGISERALQEYKAKVVERLGDKQDQAIRDEVAQDRVSTNPVGSQEVIVTGTGEVLCYDMFTGRYFQSTAENIKRAENKINYELVNHMYASATEFYDELGLPPTTFTDRAGWNSNERCEVVFSTTLSSDNRPCLAIDFRNPPFLEYERLHG
jgi:Family of unknown function (DUF6353)